METLYGFIIQLPWTFENLIHYFWIKKNSKSIKKITIRNGYFNLFDILLDEASFDLLSIIIFVSAHTSYSKYNSITCH